MINKTDIIDKSLKEDLVDINGSADGFTQEVESKSKNIKEASVSELISFSKFTLGGIILFLFALILSFVFQGFPEYFPNYIRINTGILGISQLVLFLGLVIDILRWRDFSEWGALGAFISYIGLILMFIPLIFYAIVPPEVEVTNILYIISFGLGVIIMIIGFTSHATDFDRKIENLLFLLKQWLVTFDIRQFLKTLGNLIIVFVSGFVNYLHKGIKELGTRVKRFFNWFFLIIKDIISSTWIFFRYTLPRKIKQSVIGLWNNLHWFGLAGVIVYVLLFPDFPVPANVDPFLLKLEIILILGFFFFLGILYPQRDRIVVITKSLRNNVLSRVISAYSMLSGAKLKAQESVFCSRCLRGVEKREFESLVEVRGLMNPSCPFCGFDNWVVLK